MPKNLVNTLTTKFSTELLKPFLPEEKIANVTTLGTLEKPVQQVEPETEDEPEVEQPKPKFDFFQKLEDEEDDERVNFYTEYYKNLSPSEFQIEKQKDKVVISNISKKKLENDPKFIKLLGALTLHMMDSGLKIDPLPNVDIIDNDSENANDHLGKTAYYDPNNHNIVLYTCNRHPKDILRSYAHEMIHHMQNLEGRINNIQGQNINEDDYLAELEREAYEKGNMLFRGWENNLKND
jgi:hypothetical protein